MTCLKSTASRRLRDLIVPTPRAALRSPRARFDRLNSLGSTFPLETVSAPKFQLS